MDSTVGTNRFIALPISRTLAVDTAEKPSSAVSDPKEPFVPTMTEGTQRLLSSVGQDSADISLEVAFSVDIEKTTRDFLEKAKAFERIARLDGSPQDLNPQAGVIEVEVPDQGWGKVRPHSLVASFSGEVTRGFLQTSENYPRSGVSSPSFERFTDQKISEGRAESTTLEVDCSGVSLLVQTISDLRHPEHSSQAFWIVKS